MKDVKLIRHIMTTSYKENTRIWIEPTALEAAGFNVGDSVTQTITEGAVILQFSPEKTQHSISKRKRPSWKYERPLYDSCNREITLAILPRIRIDMLVSDGMIVIRKERSFDLFHIEKPMLQGNDLKKIRLYSLPAGGGMASASLCDLETYESVGALDIWDVAIDAYLNNFKDGSAYLGDLAKKNPIYVPKADACWLSPSCTEYSPIGGLAGGVTEGHGPHYARLVLASGAEYILIEQVPNYYKSSSYLHLKKLLKPFFPDWHETIIDAYDFGSVASRKRAIPVMK